MDFLNKLWNQIQYAKLRHRVHQLPEKQQMVVGQKIYEEAYDVMKMLPGEELGACSVVFDCPYEGHVAYHISQTLDKREASSTDPVVYTDVSRLDSGSWVATAVVKSSTQQNAIAAADACVMSAVLKAKTVPASFTKYMAAVNSPDGRIPEKESVMDVLRASFGGAISE